MPKLHNFEDHLMESLKDPHEAAYFLAACLQDAIDENDDDHFFRAISAVSKASGKSDTDSLSLIHSHIAPADFPNVNENLTIMFVKVVHKIEAARKNRLQEA